ncbi:MAG: 5-oxoprolinase subunit PxpB [Proteobacteria bacterium]|nr:5-oxoprolinase subunit PxpB [Pseudomonadota bacterium]
MKPEPVILPCGDSALSVELGAVIDETLNGRVLALDALVTAESPPGVIETIPTYRSLFVVYDPVVADYATLAAWFLDRANRALTPPKPGRNWQFPVCYGAEHGIDLPFIASRTGLSEAEVVRRHAAGLYRVYMMGFLPGFTYLGGLDAAISVPRRDDPRLTSPTGTISIGGIQTGIQCLASPTGWHLIGRTPARTYDPNRDPVFFLEPGDTVRFIAVSPDEFTALERRAAAGERVAEAGNP